MHSYPAVSITPPRVASRIIRTVQSNQAACQANWMTHIATLNVTDEAKRRMQYLFTFLLEQFEALAANDSTRLEEFQIKVLKCQPFIGASDIIFLLAEFEEILMSIVWKEADVTEAEQAFRWIHSTMMNIGGVTLRNAYFPVRTPALASKTQWGSALVRLLHGLAVPGHWEWIAIVQSEPMFRIQDAAVFDKDEWQRATIDAALHRDVHEQFEAQDGFISRIIPGLYMMAKGCGAGDDVSWFMFRQIGHWVRIGLDMIKYQSQTPSDDDRFSMYQLLLELDEALMSAKNLEEIFKITATYVCRFGDFTRSALFLYSPFTYTIEGIYGYNIDLEAIRQVRETARNVPLLYQFHRLTGPIYYRDVSTMFPDYYVSYFKLTSLLLCPLIGPDNKPIGLLMLDQSGQPFEPDEKSIMIADVMTSRAAKTLAAHMYESYGFSAATVTRGLTQREQEVLQCIADGLGTKQVAERLHISEYTVTEHVSSLMRKLRAKNRTEAVAIAFRNQLIR
ncbi:response regulator transcription factor [Alicyclobacillus herbarius]|uniref:response regulator transcription factor n=1 Tax=Alicyclobacillus herbarius TaxID=122960 RepID=UPI00047AF33A|nr:response regulator transcription factor [Alicyclobacillus herbarius]